MPTASPTLPKTPYLGCFFKKPEERKSKLTFIKRRLYLISDDALIKQLISLKFLTIGL